MQWLDYIADIGTIAASLAVILTTVFIWRQLGLQTRDVDTDEKRYLRETISVIHDTMQDEKFREARGEFFAGPHKRDHGELTDTQRRRARFILSVYGLMARMLDSGAIDEALYRDYWRATLLRDWDRLENFVAGERLRSGNHALFAATEALAERWNNKHG